MLQLKRFQYNYHSESNQKKLQQCRYPEQMDFGKWTEDPTRSVPYMLYAVLVHQGSYASSGHYYVLIKVQNQWIKFNDERVEKATREKALHYNYGGNSTTIEYDSKQLKINVRSLELKATAYMLVYVNKDIYSLLFQDGEPEFPQWLIQQTKNKQYMQQQKKTRKQSICDLSILRWNKHYQGKQVSGLGLNIRQGEGDQQKIDAIPKSQKVDEWLQQLKKDISDGYVYIYWVVQDREVLICADSRGSQSVKQLFNEVQEPTIVYAPILVTKQQYLVVIKVYNQNRQQQFTFQKLGKILKNASIKQLYGLMVSLFPEEIFNNYYLQDKKLGLLKISQTENNLLPTGVPSRNQLLIVVVEQLKEGEEQKVKQWYKDQMDNMNIQFKNQQNKEFSWDRQMNKYITVQDIREIIFEEILNQNSQYQSARNIVIKFRAKKNSKVLSEAHDTDLLKDIIKIEKTLFFSYSTLSINDRLTQKELVFYYREYSRRLSDPQKIVIDKSEQSNLAQFICNSPIVLANLPSKPGHAYRLYLLAKDRSFINDVVDEKGYVPGKGDLLAILQRQKNTALVVQQYEIPEGEQEFIPVLIHHVTKTGERIGNPRWQYTQPSLLLSNLKYYILDLITDETIQFEGKVFQINPMKVRVLGYVKQWTKAQDLPQNGDLVADTQIPDETVQSKYGTPRQLRIGIIHNYISKSVQALKLNVQ